MCRTAALDATNEEQGRYERQNAQNEARPAERRPLWFAPKTPAGQDHGYGDAEEGQRPKDVVDPSVHGGDSRRQVVMKESSQEACGAPHSKQEEGSRGEKTSVVTSGDDPDK